LPPFFKGLDLNDEQKAKIGDVQKEFAPKFAELQKKFLELKKLESQGYFSVLTDAQRKKYDEDVAAAKKKPAEKKKDDKKGDKK
jgi:hypothetical protein